MAITYDKDGAYIEVTEDGVVHRRSIKWEDCVVSIPSIGKLKVDFVYVNSSNQLVLVLEDESEITVTGNGDGNVFSEILLTPKASSTGAEGTIFYDSDDDHVYVATE